MCCSVLQCVVVSRAGDVAHNARQYLDCALRVLQHLVAAPGHASTKPPHIGAPPLTFLQRLTSTDRYQNFSLPPPQIYTPTRSI